MSWYFTNLLFKYSELLLLRLLVMFERSNSCHRNRQCGNLWNSKGESKALRWTIDKTPSSSNSGSCRSSKVVVAEEEVVNLNQ
jgi:hypothetical protein